MRGNLLPGRQAVALAAVLMITCFSVHAQSAGVKLGVNKYVVTPGALLDLEDSSKGLRLTRVALNSTTTWGLSGAGDANTEGMLVYNTNASINGTATYPAIGKGVYFWDGTGWVATRLSGSRQLLDSSYWGVRGNDTPDADQYFLGTTNNMGLSLRTNNTERLRVQPDGLVGIGTRTPTANLHIAGNVRIEDGSEGDDKVLVSDATGNATWKNIMTLKGTLSDVEEATGTDEMLVPQNNNINGYLDVPGCLINYTSAVPIEVMIYATGIAAKYRIVSGATQGSFAIAVDEQRVSSAYFASWDDPNNALLSLCTTTTLTKIVSLPAGTHTFKLQVRSWVGSNYVNVNTAAYLGSGGDYAAQKSRISIAIFPND